VKSRRSGLTNHNGLQLATLLCLAGCALGGPETLDASRSYPALGAESRKRLHGVLAQAQIDF